MKWIALVLLMTGCVSADWVTREYEPVRGGAVKYLDAGADSVIESRRRDAESKMGEFCGGDYRVVKESNDSSWTTYSVNQWSSGLVTVSPMSSNYMHVYFVCNVSH